MKLHILFGHRKESYEGEYAPEPLLCWSEHEVQENGEGFADEVERTLAARGKDFQRTQMFVVRVDEDTILRDMYELTELEGDLAKAPT